MYAQLGVGCIIYSVSGYHVCIMAIILPDGILYRQTVKKQRLAIMGFQMAVLTILELKELKRAYYHLNQAYKAVSECPLEGELLNVYDDIGLLMDEIERMVKEGNTNG